MLVQIKLTAWVLMYWNRECVYFILCFLKNVVRQILQLPSPPPPPTERQNVEDNQENKRETESRLNEILHRKKQHEGKIATMLRFVVDINFAICKHSTLQCYIQFTFEFLCALTSKIHSINICLVFRLIERSRLKNI